MNYLKTLNKALQYLEDNLQQSIDLQEFKQQTTYSYEMFSRVFSILTNKSLSEYLRQMRLSEAAKLIRYSSLTITEIALSFNYDSTDAFSYAFKKFHQVTPSAVRKGADFISFQPLSFQITTKGGNQMDVRIVKKEGFYIAGIKQQAELVTELNELRFTELWESFEEKMKSLPKDYHLQAPFYGVCKMINEQEMEYYAATEIKDKAVLTQLGLQEIYIPESDYAVFTLKGPINRSIKEGWKYAMNTFFAQEKYKMKQSYDFELYLPGNIYSEDYQMELWIPITY